MTRILALCLAAAVPAAAAAQDTSLPATAKVVKLDAKPAKIALAGPFAYSQLVLTAHLDSGDAVDVTRLAKLTAPAAAAVSATGLVRPAVDGTGEIIAAINGVTVKIPVTVTAARTTPAVSFAKDVQPVLSKMGCNAGTCHGSAQGKNGFKLSLRGYDPLHDHRALTDDLEGRRFNRAAPDRSLMLLKPAGAVPHVGGVVWQPGDPNYELVKAWIAQGVKLDVTGPKVTALDIFPKNPTLQLVGGKQQFSAVATYADGTTRDVSAETFIESSNTDVATIDKAGVMTAARRGETTMLARYEGAYAASTAVIMGDRTGFVWQPVPTLNWIDELVDKKLQKIKVQPNDVCNDSEFVRRVYIDLTGLPPTAAIVRAFLADKAPTQEKRTKLVDSLVGSDGYVEHWANKWADLLQVNRKFLGDPGARALRQWVKDAVIKNVPYDKFCYDVLTASGSNVENPPAAYFKVLRDADAVMENTTQLFLAVRFNCNKCHDHPFEKWTQDQYYQMAAYFAQVSRKEDPKYKGQKIGGTAVEGAKSLVEVIDDAKAGEIKHERTGQTAAPLFPFVVADVGKADQPRRVQAAKWITSAKNPYFARSYVNRMWSYLVGVGIIDPVDDIRAGNPASNPELLDRLTTEFVKSNFDTRALVKTICRSRTYQLSINANKWNKDDDANFARGLPRRLPAEVLYDAIHVATGSITKLPGVAPGTRAAQLIDSNVELPGGFLELLGKPVRESACECERSNTMMLGPILAFVSGPVVGDAVHDPANHLAKFTMANKDDAAVVDEIYLSVLNRKPTAKEVESGVTAIGGAGEDYAKIMSAYWLKVAAFEAYKAKLDAKQAAWETDLRNQKPTAWTVLDPKTYTAKSGATFTKGADMSLFVSGKIGGNELYTVAADTTLAGVTAVRLEVLADPKLPMKGPGRAENGNLVLHELKLTYRPLDKPTDKPKNANFGKAEATFSQAGFAVQGAVDGNLATGWALADQNGKNSTAIFPLAAPIGGATGSHLSFVFEQRYADGMHTIGKFRLSVSTDKKPRLGAAVAPGLMALLETPMATRTVAQKAELRQLYLVTDAEFGRLAGEIAKVPPSDPRVLGAQDLAWALINTPAFLFNH